MHIVFFSTSNVFRAEEILIDAKIECKVVPTPVTDNPYSPDYNCERALARRELIRIKEFGEIALNSRDSDDLINDLECAYSITTEELEGGYDGDEFE